MGERIEVHRTRPHIWHPSRGGTCSDSRGSCALTTIIVWLTKHWIVSPECYNLTRHISCCWTEYLLYPFSLSHDQNGCYRLCYRRLHWLLLAPVFCLKVMMRLKADLQGTAFCYANELHPGSLEWFDIGLTLPFPLWTTARLVDQRS